MRKRCLAPRPVAGGRAAFAAGEWPRERLREALASGRGVIVEEAEFATPSALQGLAAAVHAHPEYRRHLVLLVHAPFHPDTVPPSLAVMDHLALTDPSGHERMSTLAWLAGA